MTVIEVTNLSKKYRKTTAVKDVSFRVDQGVCFGLLGPNGAGKTTTMEMIEDIIDPTTGSILYKGRPRSSAFREEIGIQFQHTALLNFLTVLETLKYYRDLYRKKETLDFLIERCDLSSILERRNHQLSGGQKQRLMLALALVNKPELIFLDEPSTGLDPQSRRHLWGIIEEIKDAGKTIIMTTHSMEEAEYLCDQIAILDEGLVIAEDSPPRLISTYCRTNSVILPRSAAEKYLACLDMPCSIGESTVTIQAAQVDAALTRLLACNVDLSEMTVHTANLEDVFLHLTGKKLRD